MPRVEHTDAYPTLPSPLARSCMVPFHSNFAACRPPPSPLCFAYVAAVRLHPPPPPPPHPPSRHKPVPVPSPSPSLPHPPGGRILVRPLYKKISEFANAEIFAATTLLMVLGTSFLTQLAGLSLALGAFLAGLLIAETEYALQVHGFGWREGRGPGLGVWCAGRQFYVKQHIGRKNSGLALCGRGKKLGGTPWRECPFRAHSGEAGWCGRVSVCVYVGASC